MSQNEKKSGWKYKGWLITAAVVILLLVSARLMLKSDWLLQRVEQLAEDQVTQILNGKLSIGELNGDLWNEAELIDLRVLNEKGEEIFTTDSVSVRYSLLSLIRSPIRIDAIEMNGAWLKAEQQSDSTWNVTQLLKAGPEPEADSEPTLFYIDSFLLRNAEAEMRSQILPEGILRIRNFNTEISGGLLETGITGRVRNLQFTIHEGRLPEPVSFMMEGSAESGNITLENLVINTGRSLLTGSGRLTDEGRLDHSYRFEPLSSQDVTAYSEAIPSFDNLKIELGFEGRPEDLSLSLKAEADGLQEFAISARMDLSEQPALTSIDVSLHGLDTPRFTQLDIPAAVGSLSLRGSGRMPFQDADRSEWEGSVLMEKSSWEDVSLERLELSYSLSDSQFRLEGEAGNQEEVLHFSGSAASLFSERPDWEFSAESERLDPSIWAGLEQLEGNLNLNINFRGESFDPDRITGEGMVEIEGDRIAGQPFTSFTLQGAFDPERISGTLRAQIRESRAQMEIRLSNWMDEVSYEYELAINRLNLAEFNGLESFPTFLNGSVQGSGNSFNPETASMVARATLDSSIVNGRRIEVLEADFNLKDKIFFVEDAALESSIADASFSLRRHIFEYTDNQNRFNFEAELKDLNPLAPLFGVNQLKSKGEIRGNLGRNDEEILEFNGELDLEQVAIDTLFNASRVRGRVSSFITETPEVDLNLMLMEPQVMNVSVQDVQAYSYIQIEDDEATGNFSFRVTNGEQSSLTQGGYFRADSSSFRIDTQSLVFETRRRALTLNEPFSITYADETLRSDSLTISSEEQSSYLSLWIPELSQNRQKASLSAKNLDVGILQQTLLKESFFEGYLSGDLSLESSETKVQASGNAFLSEIKYNNTEIDSLRMEADIAEEWLNAKGTMWRKGEELANGDLRIPYLPGDPLTFDESFYRRSLEGRFSVNPSDLNYWISFLPMEMPEATEGRISADLNLTGEAGNPDLSGMLQIQNGTFSGIPVDIVDVNLRYDHDKEEIGFKGLVEQNGLDILGFDASVPFRVDLRTFDLNFPGGQDPIAANFETNRFDLALLNSYVDRSKIRQIQGRLEGEVEISGVIEKPVSNGRLRLIDGSALMVEAGIRLQDIRSEVRFDPDRITLQQLSVRSDPGRLNASGYISMDGLTPGELDFQVGAQRFSIFNTQQIRALMNMQTNLTGTFREPHLQGQLTFLEGYYTLQDFGNDAVEDVRLEGEAETGPGLLDSLTVDMSVNFARRFLIRSNSYLNMEFALGGRVDIVKEMNKDLQLFGTLNSSDGYVTPLGKQFSLEEAIVSFYGPVANPQLSITSSYTPPQAAGVEIRYIIEGTLEKPEFRFESDPPLSTQDQISYTLFGKPYYELESWEQVISGSGSSPRAQDLALDIVLDRVSMLATRQLGIDVVEIDQSRSGSNNTVIKTGWYLNEETFFAILNEIDGVRPNTLFVLEYLLKENLELVITQGDDNRQGIDIRWHKDY